jgi:transcriptional regulator with XRE-family HTH domain
MWTEMSDPAILEELSKRFRELRLKKNIQQKELSGYSGVAIGTIRRFENGETVSTESLIKIMRGLGTLENLELLIPQEPISPMLMKKLQRKKRMRAGSTKK